MYEWILVDDLIMPDPYFQSNDDDDRGSVQEHIVQDVVALGELDSTIHDPINAHAHPTV